jgi:CRP/FNR family cyclic AMP-dependent transcriptional regulator
MKLHRDAKADLIRTIPLFAECSADELARVASVADEIDLPAGRQLTTESAPGQEVVVVVEGRAEVRRGDEVINTIGPGEFVGEVALVTGQPRTATVLATTPVHALVIEGHAFANLLADAPDIRAKVERAAAARLDRDARQADA